MHALGDRVGLEDKLGAGLWRQQRAVVLEAEGAGKAGRQRRQEALDDGLLAGHAGCALPVVAHLKVTKDPRADLVK